MAEPYPGQIRKGVVGACEAPGGLYPEVAKLLGLGEATVKRWVWKYTSGPTGCREKGGLYGVKDLSQ